VAQAMNFAKESIKSIQNTNPLFLGVLLNQIDKRRSSYLEFVTELEYLLAEKLLTTKISQTAEIADGPFYAKTVVDFKEDSKSRNEYFDLANEILRKVGLHEEITELPDNRY
jgi:cellulose biosynthesis protein BcsQ